MSALLAQDLIFIDETGVDLALTRLRGRSPRGKRAHGKRPSKRGKRVSIISAINLKEVMTHCQLIGTTDGLAFEAFFQVYEEDLKGWFTHCCYCTSLA